MVSFTTLAPLRYLSEEGFRRFESVYRTENARNASIKFRKTLELKKAEKVLPNSRVFALGEDSRALRLVSELPDGLLGNMRSNGGAIARKICGANFTTYISRERGIGRIRELPQPRTKKSAPKG